MRSAAYASIAAFFAAMAYARLPKNEKKNGLWVSFLIFAPFIYPGFQSAVAQASLVDDAFISFRYARNFIEGNGLVFNVGERVEGYTNFLWTIIIAAIMKVSGRDAPPIAVALSIACFLANLVVVFLIGARLNRLRSRRFYVPIAAPLLAVNLVFCAYATTGMETMAASLLVDLGLYALLRAEQSAGWFAVGLFFILAALTRPDHALFFLCAFPAVLIAILRQLRSASPTNAHGAVHTPSHRLFSIRTLLLAMKKRKGATGSGAPLLFYFLPFFLLFIYLVWKYSYYGSLLPNTFYSRSLYQSVNYWPILFNHVRKGLIYAVAFYLGGHFWIPTMLFLGMVLAPAREDSHARFKVFSLSAFVLFNLYVIAVGGDWMYGRFFVVLMPIIALGAESALYSIDERSSKRSARMAFPVLAAFLFFSLNGPALLATDEIKWTLYSPGAYSRIRLFPRFENQNPNVWVGKRLRQLLTDRGLLPVCATSTIGVYGYYSGLPIIDLHGLTDTVVAHSPTVSTVMDKDYLDDIAGHEKSARPDYLRARKVLFRIGASVAECPPERSTSIPSVCLDRLEENEMTRLIRRTAPELGLPEPQGH